LFKYIQYKFKQILDNGKIPGINNSIIKYYTSPGMTLQKELSPIKIDVCWAEIFVNKLQKGHLPYILLFFLKYCNKFQYFGQRPFEYYTGGKFFEVALG